jgi:hypothetical protein
VRVLPWIVVLVCSVVALFLLVDDVAAHPKPDSWGSGVPGIHKICTAVHVCHDKAPKVGPQHPCTPERHGEVVKVWDQRLSAFVEWQCRCWEGECKWYRVRIVQRPALPWEHCKRTVIDFHRACASIVCVYRAREHTYPVKRNALWCG